ncbi:putative signal transducing protein [Dyella silvatica]|uniref:putative signal transducing protein n=1 Tax=Dyella silvatica TaxID=2992128 RepID=UPI00225A9F72|nr:DUF2007 domain-containing protein [Dyella silvatica]
MTAERAVLQQRFQQMADDELLRRYVSGDMTELALQVARDELISREVALPLAEPARDELDRGDRRRGDVVCLTRFLVPTEAHILCARLNAEGIATVAGEANLLQANPFLTQAVGGVRVLVYEADLARAREIFQAFQRGDFALSEDEPA